MVALSCLTVCDPMVCSPPGSSVYGILQVRILEWAAISISTLLMLFSCSVMSISLLSHGLQHARLPCPSSSPDVFSDSCPLSWWCHPTISFSVAPFSFCLQSFPASRSFSSESALHVTWPKYWSLSFSISPSKEYSGLISFKIDWLDLPAVQGTCGLP